jgi:hypothetical protein
LSVNRVGRGKARTAALTAAASSRRRCTRRRSRWNTGRSPCFWNRRYRGKFGEGEIVGPGNKAAADGELPRTDQTSYASRRDGATPSGLFSASTREASPLTCDVSALFCDASPPIVEFNALICDVSELFCDVTALTCAVSASICACSARSVFESVRAGDTQATASRDKATIKMRFIARPLPEGPRLHAPRRKTLIILADRARQSTVSLAGDEIKISRGAIDYLRIAAWQSSPGTNEPAARPVLDCRRASLYLNDGLRSH